jgi:hypothetical protein
MELQISLFQHHNLGLKKTSVYLSVEKKLRPLGQGEWGLM